jgi:hypothetical protein
VLGLFSSSTIFQVRARWITGFAGRNIQQRQDKLVRLLVPEWLSLLHVNKKNTFVRVLQPTSCPMMGFLVQYRGIVSVAEAGHGQQKQFARAEDQHSKPRLRKQMILQMKLYIGTISGTIICDANTRLLDIVFFCHTVATDRKTQLLWHAKVSEVA